MAANKRQVLIFLHRLVLPLLGEYVDSGARSVNGRLTYSLWSNARYYAIVLGVCVVGLVYFSIQQGVNPMSFKALLVALAYWWGLALAIYLMGHGLVAVPRQLFQKADPARRLRMVYQKTPRTHENLEDATFALEQLELQVAELRRRKSGVPRELREWIDELADEATATASRGTTGFGSAVTESAQSIPATVTESYLASLTRKLSRARHARARHAESWDRLVNEAIRTQAVVDSAASKRLSFESSSAAGSIQRRLTILTPYTRHLLYYRVAPALRYSLGSVFALASICVVWSEITKLISARLSMISLTVLSRPYSSDAYLSFRGQIAAAVWLVYMCAAALTSIQDAKVWGNRALVRRNTYGESACWYASQMAKLTFPLAYNFLTFLPPDVYKHTRFYWFLGRLIDLTPLGKGSSDFLPVLILLPICATLFGLYSRTAKALGLVNREDEDIEENSSGPGTAAWIEGRDLIERELSAAPSLNQVALERRSTRAQGASGTERMPPYRDASPPTAPGRNSPRQVRPQGQASHTSTGDRVQEARPTRSTTTAAGPRPQRTTTTDNNDDDDEPEENMFTEFAHRVRNTFDVMETPRWMQDIRDSISKSGPPQQSSSSPDTSNGTTTDAPSDPYLSSSPSFFDRIFNQRGHDRRGRGRPRNDLGRGGGGGDGARGGSGREEEGRIRL